jgi:hypothetical protein
MIRMRLSNSTLWLVPTTGLDKRTVQYLADLTGGVVMELRAGVGLNDVENKGELVGYLTATYNENDQKC